VLSFLYSTHTKGENMRGHQFLVFGLAFSLLIFGKNGLADPIEQDYKVIHQTKFKTGTVPSEEEPTLDKTQLCPSYLEEGEELPETTSGQMGFTNYRECDLSPSRIDAADLEDLETFDLILPVEFQTNPTKSEFRHMRYELFSMDQS
jgi:hypothetical protein